MNRPVSGSQQFESLRFKLAPESYEIVRFRDEVILGSYLFTPHSQGTTVHSILLVEDVPTRLISGGDSAYVNWVRSELDASSIKIEREGEHFARAVVDFRELEAPLRQSRESIAEGYLQSFRGFRTGVFSGRHVTILEPGSRPKNRPYAIFAEGGGVADNESTPSTPLPPLYIFAVFQEQLELQEIPRDKLARTTKSRWSKRRYYRTHREWVALFSAPQGDNLPKVFRWWNIPFPTVVDQSITE